MAQYKTDYIDIDPDNCSKEELHNAIEKLRGLSGYYETKQLALKKFINSIYGATASKYFVGYNTNVAESITLQGQDLNHFSENSVNKYYTQVFNTQEEWSRTIHVPVLEYVEKYKDLTSHRICTKDENKNFVDATLPCSSDDIISGNLDKATKGALKKLFVETQFGPYLGITLEQAKAVDINRGRLTEQKPLRQFDKKFNEYLEGDVSMTVAGDTDSVAEGTLVYLDGVKLPIQDAFTKLKYENKDCVLTTPNGNEIVPVNDHTTKALDAFAPLLPVDSKIKYIMRHKVKKAKYRIMASEGKEVIVTEDHSCIVMRDNQILEVKPCEINPSTDKLLCIS